MTSNAMYRDNFWREMEYENFQCHPGAFPAAETSPVKHPEPSAGSSNTGFPCRRWLNLNPYKSKLMKILVPIDFSDHSLKSFEVANHFAGIMGGTVTPFYAHVPITDLDEPYTLGMERTPCRISRNWKRRLSSG